MPMKISLALGPRRELSRQTAWGCFTANLALPGSGSLAAGRVSGYGQLALALGGMVLTTVFGIYFMAWYVANWSQFHGAQADPISLLGDLWLKLRWALLGIGVFLFGWLWALSSSMDILASAKKSPPPPRLDHPLT
jgi:hypothetical protein